MNYELKSKKCLKINREENDMFYDKFKKKQN